MQAHIIPRPSSSPAPFSIYPRPCRLLSALQNERQISQLPPHFPLESESQSSLRASTLPFFFLKPSASITIRLLHAHADARSVPHDDTHRALLFTHYACGPNSFVATATMITNCEYQLPQSPLNPASPIMQRARVCMYYISGYMLCERAGKRWFFELDARDDTWYM